MERRIYPRLGETILWERLPNGLTVAIVPRPGFTKKMCYLATGFGAIHTHFSVDANEYCVPAGIAHYLEHKLFDMPDRDVAAEFAALGAVPNAFTSYDMTAYHFSCTENFEAALELLLEFVFTPYFTEQSVQKEQGIIGQEIDMNLDAPESCIFEQLMRAMYRVHPVRIPILGTKKSIAQITPQNLTLCHDAFYRPDNMLLCIVGDVAPDRVREIAMQKCPQTPAGKVKATRTWQEEMTCLQPICKCNMEVAMPAFQIGFKCASSGDGEQAVYDEIVADLAAEVLFGESSRLYLDLYERGLIDGSFGGGFETIEGMAMLTLSGDSDTPETVRDAVLEEAKRLLSEGIEEESLRRMKRSALGRRLRGLDSFDSVCFRICAYYFLKFDYFDFPAVYEKVTAEDVLAFLRETVTPERCCMSVIHPVKEEL